MNPYMKEKEIKLFQKYLQKSKKYFEFGSGGSTVFAIKNGVELIHTIETDLEWIKKIKEEKLIKNKIIKNELFIDYIDLNCTWWKHVSWGPKNELCDKKNWTNYHKAIQKCSFKPDLILIDGRFRVASALESIKHLDNNGYILFHDYPHRKQYHVVEKFLKRVAKKKSLRVFKPKDNINFEELNKTINQYKLIID